MTNTINSAIASGSVLATTVATGSDLAEGTICPLLVLGTCMMSMFTGGTDAAFVKITNSNQEFILLA